MSPRPLLQATYASPTSDQTFRYSLPAISADPSTDDKTSYLAALRESVVKLQDEVNTFLTRKMEEDKAAEGGAAVQAQSGGVDDRKEEEQYGEEVVDEDV